MHYTICHEYEKKIKEYIAQPDKDGRIIPSTRRDELLHVLRNPLSCRLPLCVLPIEADILEMCLKGSHYLQIAEQTPFHRTNVKATCERLCEALWRWLVQNGHGASPHLLRDPPQPDQKQVDIDAAFNRIGGRMRAVKGLGQAALPSNVVALRRAAEVAPVRTRRDGEVVCEEMPGATQRTAKVPIGGLRYAPRQSGGPPTLDRGRDLALSAYIKSQLDSSDKKLWEAYLADDRRLQGDKPGWRDFRALVGELAGGKRAGGGRDTTELVRLFMARVVRLTEWFEGYNWSIQHAA